MLPVYMTLVVRPREAEKVLFVYIDCWSAITSLPMRPR